MPSRSDQLHSYQFAVRRVVSAVAAHREQPGAPARPAGGVMLLAGALVAALGLAGFAVWGLLSTGRIDPVALRPGRDRGEGVRGQVRLPRRRPAPGGQLRVGAAHRRFREAVDDLGGPALAGRCAARPPLGIAGAPDALPPRRDLPAGRGRCAAWARGPFCSWARRRPGARRSAGPACCCRPRTAPCTCSGTAAGHLVRDPAMVLCTLVLGRAPSPVGARPGQRAAGRPGLARVPITGRGQDPPLRCRRRSARSSWSTRPAARRRAGRRVGADHAVPGRPAAHRPRPERAGALAQGQFADLPQVAAPDPAGLPPTTPAPRRHGLGVVRAGSGVPRSGWAGRCPAPGVVVQPGRAALVEAREPSTWSPTAGGGTPCPTARCRPFSGTRTCGRSAAGGRGGAGTRGRPPPATASAAADRLRRSRAEVIHRGLRSRGWVATVGGVIVDRVAEIAGRGRGAGAHRAKFDEVNRELEAMLKGLMSRVGGAARRVAGRGRPLVRAGQDPVGG